jgi:hypothetical protein
VSSQNLNNQPGFTRRPTADLYTVLLIFALLALLLGILYLHLEMKAYNYKAATGMATTPAGASYASPPSPVDLAGLGVQGSGFRMLHSSV